jgi:DNA-binding response OmpR family regulator
LVCDDEPTMGDAFRAVLEEEGYQVTVLPRLSADLDDVIGLYPALIILDVFFAGQPTGQDFLGRLKTTPATMTIPELVCSAADGLVDAQIAAWQCGSVAKPFELDDLLAAVRTCLGAGARSPHASSLTSRGRPAGA